MTFEAALAEVKRGRAMRLPHWSPEVVIRVHRPYANNKMTNPYLYVESRFGCVPWKETFVEMFNDNWEVED